MSEGASLSLRLVDRLLRGKQAAQDVVEYGIIIATIAIVVLLGTTAFGNQIRPWFEMLAGRITTIGT
jgi:Flp pilus assembly pilin Flp